MNTNSASGIESSPVRLRVVIRGAVQGVGFRPFVYRLAKEIGLNGWVNNSAQGVFIEVEGRRTLLESFLLRLGREKPPNSSIQSLEPTWLDASGFDQFEIRKSSVEGLKDAIILPDIATCPDCLRDIFEPGNRRYFYPFTNCTNCGPRFSIIEALPYDRPNTSMRQFAMCPLCQAEYDDPGNRRFHAQPNACPVCGPQLEYWDAAGNLIRPAIPAPAAQFLSLQSTASYAALFAAVEDIQAGKIVAVKGLGGFHLIVAAHAEQAVRRLRERKHREEKPFAIMFPSLDAAKQVCHVSALEERLLCAPEAPIVLLRRLTRQPDSIPDVAASVAPGNPNLGALLPYTPLHHLLLHFLKLPVVATSGNLSDEPICIEEHDAVERLKGIADAFLVHNRPIVRHVDDSLVRVVSGRELVLRRARGYAPLPISHPDASSGSATVLGVGAHLKNAVALSKGSHVFISQHVGDLETDQAYEAFRCVIEDFQRLYEAVPSIVVSDAHPDYLSSKFARQLASQISTPSPKLLTVQHHMAHVFSCMAENELSPPILGVAWDGTGFGLDGTVWGGEFFVVNKTEWKRFAHLRPFPLPGGDQAVKEPRRTALGLLYAAHREAAFEMHHTRTLSAFGSQELAFLKTMLRRRLNSPLSSGVGRLFDAVGSLVGVRQHVRFEGQAAMELEFALEGAQTNALYPLDLIPSKEAGTAYVLDWAPLLDALLEDMRSNVSTAVISAKFHNGLAESIIMVGRKAGIERVTLSGGCFQNRYLSERAIQRLLEAGFRPYWHQRVPPNDGGIALGQVMAALRAESSS